MKRLMLIFALAFVLFGAFSVSAEGEITTEINVALDDVTLEYSPNGYMPEATFTYPLSAADIHYLAIDKNTSEPVELPLMNVGEYVVKAYTMIGDVEVSDIANVTITPVKVTISVPYDKLRYTGDEIIPEYTVYPEWTAEYFQLNITYIYYKEKSPASTKVVDAPLSLGKYYVKMTPYGTGDNIECDGKAYILTVAENGGKKLSESKATAPVGSGISCVLEDQISVYDGTSPKMNYTMTPKCAAPDLYFRLIGTSDEPTMMLPTEPGEYEVTAVLCNQVLSRSTLVINKRTPVYKLDSMTYQYTQSGIIPQITSANNENVEFSILAYLVDENDMPISSESLPLRKIGKYLLIINPIDTTHYEALYSPEYIYIEKCTPKITSEPRSSYYDGFSKSVAYNVTPSWVNSKIEYFKIDENGNVIDLLGSDPPVNVGSYLAEISVEATDTNEAATLSVIFSIEPSPNVTVSRPEESETQYLLLGIASTEFVLTMISVPLSLIILFFVFVFLQRKRERRR